MTQWGNGAEHRPGAAKRGQWRSGDGGLNGANADLAGRKKPSRERLGIWDLVVQSGIQLAPYL
ncbi:MULTISPECIES: hypothetical protein [Ralstonia]|uniref:hypothetical protein n=1 Tax=Ralstonia TaxID=48736 RepID=UPI0011AF81C7|nr:MULTISPECIES: hypothetical protein [Ralstonia]